MAPSILYQNQKRLSLLYSETKPLAYFAYKSITKVKRFKAQIPEASTIRILQICIVRISYFFKASVFVANNRKDTDIL